MTCIERFPARKHNTYTLSCCGLRHRLYRERVGFTRLNASKYYEVRLDLHCRPASAIHERRRRRCCVVWVRVAILNASVRTSESSAMQQDGAVSKFDELPPMLFDIQKLQDARLASSVRQMPDWTQASMIIADPGTCRAWPRAQFKAALVRPRIQPVMRMLGCHGDWWRTMAGRCGSSSTSSRCNWGQLSTPWQHGV